MASIGYRAIVMVRIEAVPAGVGGAGLGGLNANDPAYGQGQTPGTTAFAQSLYFQDAVPIPGGSAPTLANINTALTTAVSDLAAASGTPLITPAQLAIIQGWATGNP
jgi:hypothetical protein